MQGNIQSRHPRSSLFVGFLTFTLLTGAAPGIGLRALAGEGQAITSDEIFLVDGSVLRGLIVHQDAKGVTLQKPFSEVTIPSVDILRIHDVEDDETAYVKITKPGQLPPWRVLANDMRNKDRITSFFKIPATAIEDGLLKNVPYSSFLANRMFELNIYGDPEDPAALELGVYGVMKYSRRAREFIRSFFASYLSDVEEIRALYDLDFRGDKETVGPIVMEVTPPGAPDSLGAWWITLYNPEKLDAVRLSDEEYEALTHPIDEVRQRRKRIGRDEWRPNDLRMANRSKAAGEDGRVFLRGFYRDKNGRFQLVGMGSPESPD
jgi:hypothetical protein